MPFTNAALNYMLDQLGANKATHASLHTADPGSTGTNEVSGGSPAYARQAMTWNAAASGNLDSSNQPAFDVPGGVTVTHAGFFDALTAGNFQGSAALASSETFGAQGTLTLTDADLSLS